MTRRSVAVGAVAVALGSVLMLSLVWGLQHAALSNPPVLGRSAPNLAIQTQSGDQVSVNVPEDPSVDAEWAALEAAL